MQNAPMLPPGCPASPTTCPLSGVVSKTTAPFSLHQPPPSGATLLCSTGAEHCHPVSMWPTRCWHLAKVCISLSPRSVWTFQSVREYFGERWLFLEPTIDIPTSEWLSCFVYTCISSSVLSPSTLKLICASGLNGEYGIVQINLRTCLSKLSVCLETS